MEPSTRYTLVGLVVIALFALVIFTILWLSGTMGTNKVKYFTIYFREHSLSGLQVDSNVTMRGIKVGSVADFEISPQNVEHVKVLVRIDADTPIKRDTEAIVSRNLLTGLATIELVGTSQESPPLVDVLPGDEHPVIREGKAPLEKLATSATSIAENVNASLERLNTFLSEENQESFSRLLRNMESISASFSDGTNRIERTIERMDRVFAEIEKLSKTLSGEVSGLGSTFKESATQLTLQVAGLAREVSLAARAISQAAERLEDPRGLLFGPSTEQLGPGESIR
ncbi:MAG: MCE family protein [Deltaproteobacteria bacterium]|nr:MCE family protein [Deltaproteobacteria bacterium]